MNALATLAIIAALFVLFAIGKTLEPTRLLVAIAIETPVFARFGAIFWRSTPAPN